MCQTAVVFVPVRGIPLINRLLSYSHNRAVILIGDEGICLKDEIFAVKNPPISIDGGFSFPVHFHVFHEHCINHGGFTTTSEYHEQYRVMMCSYGVGRNSLPRTQLSFRQFVLHHAPSDVAAVFEENRGNPSFSLITCLMRLTEFDNDNFVSLRQVLLSSNTEEALQSIDSRDLFHMLARVVLWVCCYRRFENCSFPSILTRTCVTTWRACTCTRSSTPSPRSCS